MRRACAKVWPLLISDLLGPTETLFGFGQRGWRADMHPLAVHAHAVGPAGANRPAPYEVEREGALRAAVEQTRMGDRHAGEGEGHDLLLDALAADTPVAVQREVASALVAMASRGDRQQQQAIHGRVVPGARQTRQIGAHSLDP